MIGNALQINKLYGNFAVGRLTFSYVVNVSRQARLDVRLSAPFCTRSKTTRTGNHLPFHMREEHPSLQALSHACERRRPALQHGSMRGMVAFALLPRRGGRPNQHPPSHREAWAGHCTRTRTSINMKGRGMSHSRAWGNQNPPHPVPTTTQTAARTTWRRYHLTSLPPHPTPTTTQTAANSTKPPGAQQRSKH